MRDDHDEEEPQEENLQLTYQAKFPILSHEQGARFTKNKFKEMVAYKYILLFYFKMLVWMIPLLNC